MDWTGLTAAVAVPAIVVGGAYLVVLCRAAAAGDRPRPAQAARSDAADAPPAPVPRTPCELVACALVTLDVEHVTLFCGDRHDRLRALARGHLDARADAEPPDLHAEAAAEAALTSNRVEIGGVAPAPVVAAVPILRKGRLLGVLVVSAQRPSRGRMTFAERRDLTQLASYAGMLTELRRPRRRALPG